LAQAFYLDRLNLPQTGKVMTATEATARISEYIRNVSPLFQALESEYNAAMCSLIFRILARNAAFLEDVPEGLLKEGGDLKDVKFIFENPLIEAEGKDKVQKFLEAQAALSQSASLDPSVIDMLDTKIALRDVMNSSGVPAKWLRSEEDVAQIEDQKAQAAEAQQMIEQLGQGAQVAEQLGKAGQAINQAGIM
jgi:hypothetical protein